MNEILVHPWEIVPTPEIKHISQERKEIIAAVDALRKLNPNYASPNRTGYNQALDDVCMIILKRIQEEN